MHIAKIVLRDEEMVKRLRVLSILEDLFVRLCSCLSAGSATSGPLRGDRTQSEDQDQLIKYKHYSSARGRQLLLQPRVATAGQKLQQERLSGRMWL